MNDIVMGESGGVHRWRSVLRQRGAGLGDKRITVRRAGGSGVEKVKLGLVKWNVGTAWMLSARRKGKFDAVIRS